MPQISTYKGNEVDLFAFGIVLYELYAGEAPWQRAHINDPDYKKIIEGDFFSFWDKPERRRLSDDFKSLFMGLTYKDPGMRYSIADLMSHPWFQQNVTQQEVVRQLVHLREKEQNEELENQLNRRVGI